MKKLETFLMLLHKEITKTYHIYDVAVGPGSKVKTFVNRINTNEVTFNNTEECKKLVFDIYALKDLIHYVIVSFRTTGGQILMQYKYIFDTEEILFEYSTNGRYENIGRSILKEFNFFINIGYYDDADYD